MPSTGKSWYKSKTVWFGVLTTLIGIAGAFGFGEYLPDEAIAEVISTVVLVVVGVMNFVLRMWFTDKPIK